MLPALGGAGIAHVGANLAKGICMIAFQAHELRGSAANGGTFHIKLYALRHLFYHPLLSETGGRTVITGGGTLQAGIDAGLVSIFHTTKIFVDE